MSQKPIIALIYDFDKTLSTKAMQEYTFIPSLNLKPKEFWKMSDNLVEKLGMDQVLAYMYLMIKESGNRPIRRGDFVDLGKNIKFFPGVCEWFGIINEYGKEKDVELEHYIISSGLREIINGTPIKDEFKAIFGSEFHYDKNGVADWPLWAVNYTAKTQFLFRINKGALALTENDKVNDFLPNSERRVPFEQMIYIGDGITDIPCMKLVKENGGCSLCVYGARKGKAQKLLADGRVNFIARADFREDKYLMKMVKLTIDKIAADHRLKIEEKKLSLIPFLSH
jgi:2-hydroxy-3-keto-5-methylthiopentenyl-1-phosphate phosphatase